jgi:hypothetical protein
MELAGTNFAFPTSCPSPNHSPYPAELLPDLRPRSESPFEHVAPSHFSRTDGATCPKVAFVNESSLTLTSPSPSLSNTTVEQRTIESTPAKASLLAIKKTPNRRLQNQQNLSFKNDLTQVSKVLANQDF